jgi:hypothetical protein
MSELGGWIIFAISAAIALYTAWTFIPEPVGESFRNLLVRIARGLGWISARLARLIQRGLYRLLTGRPLPSFAAEGVSHFSDDDLDYVPPPLAVSPRERSRSPVAATVAEPRNGIAIERNERNAPLTGNIVARAQALLIARLLKSEMLYIPDGKGGYRRITQTALIKLATGLEPNGRPDSDYGLLRAELEPLINPVLVIDAGKSTERVIAK